MCFHSQQSLEAQALEHRFKAKFEAHSSYLPAIYNGFLHPKTPVIIHTERDKIQLLQWGLIPFWSKDTSIQKNTLNARIETIHEKPSFRDIVNNRCLILADAFFEWQWLDEKGKKKQKYALTLPEDAPFALAGLWSDWVDQSTGEVIRTYTILTTAANELMSKIHNTKQRMPVIISPEHEESWLMGGEMVLHNEYLVATEI